MLESTTFNLTVVGMLVEALQSYSSFHIEEKVDKLVVRGTEGKYSMIQI
jgi:low affinity Fe/Cu permease